MLSSWQTLRLHYTALRALSGPTHTHTKQLQTKNNILVRNNDVVTQEVQAHVCIHGNEVVYKLTKEVICPLQQKPLCLLQGSQDFALKRSTLEK